jgi:heptosyltransferase-2
VYFWGIEKLDDRIFRLRLPKGVRKMFYISDEWPVRWVTNAKRYPITWKIRIWELIEKTYWLLRCRHWCRFEGVEDGLDSVFPEMDFASSFLLRKFEPLSTPRQRLGVIPWGVDPQTFLPGAQQESEGIRILYVGQIMPHKGVLTLIDALSWIREKHPTVKFTLNLAGGSVDPAYEEKVRITVRDRNLSPMVTFLGPKPREEVANLYRAHDILAFSSLWDEPFAITVLEAMASGMAIVATRTGGTPEAIQDSQNGLLVEAGRPEPLGEAIVRLAGDAKLRQQLGEAARKTIISEFTLSHMEEKIQGILQASSPKKVGPASAGKKMIRKVLRWLADPRTLRWFVAGRKKQTEQDIQTAMARAERILVIRPDRIGDAVLFSAFLRELRRAKPKARIVLVCSPVAAPVYRGCPYVNRVVEADLGEPIWEELNDKTAGPIFRRILAAWKFARASLVQERAQIVLHPRLEADGYGAAYLALGSGAPCRVSYTETATPWRAKMNERHDLLWSHCFPAEGVKHEVERNLEFLERLGVPILSRDLEVWPSKSAEDKADKILGAVDSRGPICLMAPGASHAARQWPVSHFAEVGRRILDRGGRLVVTGSETERGLCEELARQTGFPERVLLVCGEEDLGVVMGLAKRSKLFLGNDSGPAHIAAAAGTVVLALSGHPPQSDAIHFSSPERFRPWGKGNLIFQPESGGQGIESISVERVWPEVENHLKKA